MESKYVVTNISEALTTRAFPTVTVWNRLEGRPRTANFDRALKAEVRDALWMLTRQWQMGELRGDDAGSPVFAKIHVATTRLNKYKPGDHPTEAFDDNVPLEAEVERRPIRFKLGLQIRVDGEIEIVEQKLALELRLQMGRQWLKLVKPVGDYAGEFKKKYPIVMPDPNRKEDALVCAHPEVWQSFAAVAAERMMDGAELYLYLKQDAAHHAWDGITVSSEDDKGKIDALAVKFIEWFERLYYQPPASGEDAWEPSQLEYQFACSAPEAAGEKVLAAEEYYHGHLDWYNFDVDKASRGLGEVSNGDGDPRGTRTQTLIPAPILFDGMPNTRWWAFEDRRTNFGDVKPDTTDLAKLLLIEFGLVYANDWFLVPFELPLGSIAAIEGMAVTNVFGERFWIEAAGSGADDDWQRWSMFTLNLKGKAEEAADTSLLLLPTVPNVQEGRPVEDVMFIRDEVANMVWGIERAIALPDGASKPGGEAAIETLNFYKRLLAKELAGAPPATPIEYKANIRYESMNAVPENLIPFIPVHVENNNREIRLQRAAMPRLLEGDPDKPVKVRPRTALLREGLDSTPRSAYFVNEEEVPRAGARVTQSFQRTRWRNGRVFIWLGVRKQTGRGEGSSGLAFDRLVDVQPAT
jgi:hypothetical protein